MLLRRPLPRTSAHLLAGLLACLLTALLGLVAAGVLLMAGAPLT